jgi:Zn-dependent M28 family amino/carboxypeptidase
LAASNQLWKVQAMVDMDMIAYTQDADLDCLLETEEFAQTLLDLLADAANQFTSLRIETTFYAWGSDHVPYLAAGLPAILTIENDWSDYPYYHTTNDLPHHLTVAMGEEILKMNVAAVAAMAGASVSMDFTDGFESGDTSGWTLAVP